MDLNNLPDVQFASKDINEILNDMILGFELAHYQQTGEKMTLYPGDKRRIFLYSQALREFQLRQLIDFSAKQNLLKYSSGDFLDNLGAFQNVERDQAKAAVVTEKFVLSGPQTVIQTIPQGTRCSSSGSGIYFKTTENIEVPVGTTEISAVLECMIQGESGNDFAPGQINVLCDPLPWIASVTNTDTSQGGTDIEEDDTFRENIREAPEGFSVAGPEGAYTFFTKKFNSNISDIELFSDNPGEVDISILLKNGEIPTEAFLKEISDYLNDKTIRPLTDKVVISAPNVVNYDIALTYYIRNDDAAMAPTIQSNVNQIIDDYVLWQKSKIGRSINPSELTTRIVNAGAKRVEISKPVYTTITKKQVAAASSNISVNYGGLEDD